MRTFGKILLGVSLLVPCTSFAGERNDYRAAVIAKSKRPTIAPGYNDQARNLVDEFRFDSLAEMESAKLQAAQLASQPWSDSYWPTYAGQIANRYADPDFASTNSWRENASYLESRIGKGDEEELSPAEKYDLLVGDTNFTLTRSMIRTGELLGGQVPTWFGLCHGWAPASFMMKRPVRAVKAVTPDGRKLTFYPSDLKALATLLWANGAPETRFIGGRCEKDSAGRDPDCFDTNPATWHLAIVNQIAVSRRSFVMDATASKEVWNQPVFGYNYKLINPLTGKTEQKLAAAKVRREDYRGDKFASRRDASAVAIVNVLMEVKYMAETGPSHNPTDSAAQDAVMPVYYNYDLELDASDKIVGGEWHDADHPDFLWVPVKDGEATSPGDQGLNRRRDFRRWSPLQPVPAEWRAQAKFSAESELPLARVVKGLFSEF